MINAFKCGMAIFEAGDDKPIIDRLDKDCSDHMKLLCKAIKITIAKVPPCQHPTNAAEREREQSAPTKPTLTPPCALPTRIFHKTCGTNKSSTLNFIRACRSNPTLLTYVTLRGYFTVKGFFDINNTCKCQGLAALSDPTSELKQFAETPRLTVNRQPRANSLKSWEQCLELRNNR